MLRIFEAGDIAGAHAHFVQAGKIGARFAHRELITLARIGEGRMLIYLGEIAEGMALLDEAMVSIEAGELSPLATGDAYCTVIDACAELFDLGRCRAWTDVVRPLVRHPAGARALPRPLLPAPRRGARAARSVAARRSIEARHACDRLAAPVNPTALAGACAIEGDLLRLVGDLDGAEAAYQRASEIGRDPQPGLALLRLAQGRLDAADAMIRRALGEAQDPISRARLLGAYVEIVLAAGDTAAAARRRRRAPRDRPPSSARRSCGRTPRAPPAPCCLAEDDATAALVELRRAFNEFNALGVRYDAARTRLLIADACDALGDHDAARIESSAARAVLDVARRDAADHDRIGDRRTRRAHPARARGAPPRSPAARRTG